MNKICNSSIFVEYGGTRMNKINLEKNGDISEENIEKLGDDVYRIYPTITKSPERKKRNEKRYYHMSYC